MQLVPILAVAAVALLASSGRKKKRAESAKPAITRFGRVQRLLNQAAVMELANSGAEVGPTVFYTYNREDEALERVTKLMVAYAEAFQHVSFYQMPLSALKGIFKFEANPTKGISGALVGSTRDEAVWTTPIFPKDDAHDIGTKISQRIIFATTGARPQA